MRRNVNLVNLLLLTAIGIVLLVALGLALIPGPAGVGYVPPAPTPDSSNPFVEASHSGAISLLLVLSGLGLVLGIAALFIRRRRRNKSSQWADHWMADNALSQNEVDVSGAFLPELRMQRKTSPKRIRTSSSRKRVLVMALANGALGIALLTLLVFGPVHTGLLAPTGIPLGSISTPVEVPLGLYLLVAAGVGIGSVLITLLGTVLFRRMVIYRRRARLTPRVKMHAPEPPSPHLTDLLDNVLGESTVAPKVTPIRIRPPRQPRLPARLRNALPREHLNLIVISFIGFALAVGLLASLYLRFNSYNGSAPSPAPSAPAAVISPAPSSEPSVGPTLTPTPTATPTPEITPTPTPEITPTPTPKITPTPTPKITPTPTPEITPTPTPSPTPTASPTPTPNYAARRAALPACPDWGYCGIYIAKSGDTLNSIAAYFDDPTAILLAWNPSITDPNAVITTGQRIRILR